MLLVPHDNFQATVWNFEGILHFIKTLNISFGKPLHSIDFLDSIQNNQHLNLTLSKAPVLKTTHTWDRKPNLE